MINNCPFKMPGNLGTRLFCNLGTKENHGTPDSRECIAISNCEFKKLNGLKDLTPLEEELAEKALDYWVKFQLAQGKLNLYKQQLNKIEKIAKNIKEDRYDYGYKDILEKIEYLRFDKYEITGNIYENPELLEVKND